MQDKNNKGQEQWNKKSKRTKVKAKKQNRKKLMQEKNNKGQELWNKKVKGRK